jgi:ATP adenylyltransferase
MDYIWTPWRYQYIKDGGRKSSCVFCDIAASKDDENNLVVHRAESNYVVLNRFPYTSGHAMVVPYEHVATLQEARTEVVEEMMRLTRRLEGVLRKLYRPSGLNIGMNIGEAAGAGVAGHLHMHVLPRWVADSNFMAVVGETRILPEELSETWGRLRAGFETLEKLS